MNEQEKKYHLLEFKKGLTEFEKSLKKHMTWLKKIQIIEALGKNGN